MSSNSSLSLSLIFKMISDRKWWLAAFSALGVVAGLGFAQVQKPAYRVEMIVTPPAEAALDPIRMPYLRLGMLLSTPNYKWGSLMVTPPTTESLFTDFMRRVRALSGMEAALRSPEISEAIAKSGLTAAEVSTLERELKLGTRMVNLGMNWERTRVVLNGSNPELMQLIGMKFLEASGVMTWEENRKVVQSRTLAVKEYIEHRRTYMKALQARGAANVYKAALLDVEIDFLESDLHQAQALLDYKPQSTLFCTVEGAPEISLLRPKPALYSVIGALLGLMVGLWIVLWQNRSVISRSWAGVLSEMEPARS